MSLGASERDASSCSFEICGQTGDPRPIMRFAATQAPGHHKFLCTNNCDRKIYTLVIRPLSFRIRRKHTLRLDLLLSPATVSGRNPDDIIVRSCPLPKTWRPGAGELHPRKRPGSQDNSRSQPLSFACIAAAPSDHPPIPARHVLRTAAPGPSPTTYPHLTRFRSFKPHCISLAFSYASIDCRLLFPVVFSLLLPP